jgi:hypothetical protein
MGKRKKNKQRFTKHYTNINKANNHLLPQSIEHVQKKTSRNSGLAQTPNCGVVKSVNGILPVPS